MLKTFFKPGLPCARVDNSGRMRCDGTRRPRAEKRSVESIPETRLRTEKPNSFALNKPVPNSGNAFPELGSGTPLLQLNQPFGVLARRHGR